MKTLASCSRGAVAVLSAIVLPILLGFGTLGVEVGHWYLTQRQMQGAADAAAISATAEYIAQFRLGNFSGTTYQGVGQSYASLNGFTIPIANVCLIPMTGSDNCGTVRSLDARPIICQSPPCLVVEITQNTMQWLTTQASMQPNGIGRVGPITGPTLLARSIVSAKSQIESINSKGTDCVLALANDPQAVLVHGNNADIKANCGIAIDGGLDQNVGGPALGGITFSGSGAKVNISNLTVAANSTNCPDGGQHCQLYNSTAPLPASAVKLNTATPDPYASMTFPTPPSGVKTGGVAISTPGSGYTNGTRTFTVVGGTGTPAKFTATVAGGIVIAVGPVTDPGAYTAFPSGPVSVTPDTGGGSGATFTLSQGCFTWVSGSTPLPDRKYCSINLNGAGTTNFPGGKYYIAGGDINCVGFCVSSANANVTSDIAGVTFYLTNGEGSGTFGTSSYAHISVFSGNISLCAPDTNCGTGCTGSCLLFVQNPLATPSTGQGTPANTINTFAGNGNRTVAGLIYLPRQTFQLQGNSAIGGCFGLIAKYVDDGGTPTFSDGCLPGNGIGGGTTTTQTTLANPYLYQ